MTVKTTSTLLIIITLIFLGCDKQQQPITLPPDDLPPSRAEAQAKAIEHVKMLQDRQNEKYQKAIETNDTDTLWAELDTLYLKSDLLAPYVEAGFTAKDLGAPLWYSLSRTLLSIHLTENPAEAELFLEVLQHLLEAMPELVEANNPVPETVPNLEEIPPDPPDAEDDLTPKDDVTQKLILPTKELPQALHASMPTLWGLLVEYLTLTYQYPVKRGKEIQDLFLKSANNGNTTVNPKTIEARFGITFKPGDVLFWQENPLREATSEPGK